MMAWICLRMAKDLCVCVCVCVLFIYFGLCWVFVSVRGLSLVVASGSHSSSRCTGLPLSRLLLLRSTGSRRAGSVVVAHGMWDLPRPGLEPMSPALAGRFSTTAPPGKPWQRMFQKKFEPNLGQKTTVEKYWQFGVGSVQRWSWEDG